MPGVPREPGGYLKVIGVALPPGSKCWARVHVVFSSVAHAVE